MRIWDRKREFSSQIGSLPGKVLHDPLGMGIDIASLFAQEANEGDVLPPSEIDRHS
jgi:hypothetical protein